MIALVMDSFTDTDIFTDLLEACSQRQVKAYILLDQSSFSHFLKMCKDLGVDLEQEKLMRVRNITGNTYYTRSGAKIVGKVHEKFMLIDGIRVTTGSYSFTWMDGKLNSSNILILSGPAVAHFDQEFRTLYAHSKPVNLKEFSSSKKNKVFDELCVCASSWEGNLKLRESNTGIVISVEHLCNVSQQIQLWCCLTHRSAFEK
uniref:Scaffolding anchor of CK1 domain-containing protein n=1 Tax=Gallus gallus TaxID=9031 RepID=A0A8V0ZUA7_CHICK